MNRPEYVTVTASGAVDRNYEADWHGDDLPDAIELRQLTRDLADVERAERRVG